MQEARRCWPVPSPPRPRSQSGAGLPPTRPCRRGPGSRHPGLRAAEALGLILPLYLVLFASTYFLMERASAASFTQPLTRTDALYFTVTVFSTVGFGDITAKSETARIVLIIQMLADLAVLSAGIRVLLGTVQRGRERRSDTGDDARPAAG